MDTIEFYIKRTVVPWGRIDMATMFVNGVDFIELAREYETPLAKKGDDTCSPGDYMNVMPYALFRILASPEPKDYDENGRLLILLCSCGIDECNSLFMKIRETEQTVIWEDFKKIRSEDWDYSNFGPFEFDKTHYFHQIENPTYDLNTQDDSFVGRFRDDEEKYYWYRQAGREDWLEDD